MEVIIDFGQRSRTMRDAAGGEAAEVAARIRQWPLRLSGGCRYA